MRLLDATFQAAMDSGHFTPIVRAAILDPDDHSVIQYLDLKYFKINGLDIDVEFYDPSGSFTDKISLERGVKVGETEYTIFSGEYFLTSSYQVTGGATGLYKCSGSLIEPAGVNLAGDVTYHAIIDSVLALGDCAAAWKHPAAAWLSYQFLADGAFFHTSNIYTFFTLLKQKYLVYATENGIESILFFDVSSVLAGASQYTVTLNDRDTWSSFANYRQFVWRDETDTVSTDGPAGYPIHNLGYLESTASPPVIPNYKMPIGEVLLTVMPNLKYQTGDLVTFDANIDGVGDVNTVIDVTEIFDARDNRLLRPTWRMELRPLQYFANTEGGHIEASSQYTTPYVPLSTSGFHGLLDDSVSNLQTLADAVDGLAIGGSGTAGRVAQFDSARVLEASNLVGPAANVLTLEATGVYTLTVPATGTAALLGTNQTFTGFNYFSKGLFASGYTAPTGFVGVEILYLNGVGYIDAYDYVNSVELPLSIDGSSVAINGVAFTGTVGGLINLEISNGRELTLVCTNDLSLTIAATASISGTNTGDNAVNSRYDIGSDTQAWSAKLDTIAALANAAGVLTNNGAGVLSWGAGGGDISGTGIAGQVAEFVTDTKTIQAANLIAPANLLTLVAAAPYSLTVPNTGTVAMLGITNAFTSTNTFTATTENLINGTATLTATSGSRDGFIFTTNVSPTIDGTGNYRNVEYIIQSGNTKEISTMINFQAYQNINSYAVGLSGFVIQTAYGASANVVYHKEFSIQQDTKAVGAAVANKYALYIDDITHGNNNWSIYTNAGNVVFNAGGDASTDFTIRSDNYDAVVVDGSEDSIVLMSNAAGKVGFFGAAAVVRQTGPFSQETGYIAGQLDSEAEIIAAFNTTNEGINTIRTALINYGLITDE